LKAVVQPPTAGAARRSRVGVIPDEDGEDRAARGGMPERGIVGKAQVVAKPNDRGHRFAGVAVPGCAHRGGRAAFGHVT